MNSKAFILIRNLITAIVVFVIWFFATLYFIAISQTAYSHLLYLLGYQHFSDPSLKPLHKIFGIFLIRSAFLIGGGIWYLVYRRQVKKNLYSKNFFIISMLVSLVLFVLTFVAMGLSADSSPFK